MLNVLYTPISRKVVGKSARDNSERYCGRFWVLLSSKKFERMAQETMDLCFQMLKESTNRRFNRYSVRNSVLIKSHITFRDCRLHIFSDNLSWSSCILGPFRHNNIKPGLLPEWTRKDIEQLPNFFFSATDRNAKHVIYTYFEKSCRKKCTRQSRKVLWAVLSS